jgi:hypothetical protein
VLGSALASGAWQALPLALPVVALLWLMFSVLRVTVSAGSVKVQYGFFGPEIPIAAIESAEATSYDWKRFGGWGIRRGIGGEWIYNMPGDGGRAARIVWRDAKGRRRVVLIGSPRAEALAAAVQGATGRRCRRAEHKAREGEGESARRRATGTRRWARARARPRGGSSVSCGACPADMSVTTCL